MQGSWRGLQVFQVITICLLLFLCSLFCLERVLCGPGWAGSSVLLPQPPQRGVAGMHHRASPFPFVPLVTLVEKAGGGEAGRRGVSGWSALVSDAFLVPASQLGRTTGLPSRRSAPCSRAFSRTSPWRSPRNSRRQCLPCTTSGCVSEDTVREALQMID